MLNRYFINTINSEKIQWYILYIKVNITEQEDLYGHLYKEGHR